MIRYELPAIDDLLRLGEPHKNAVSIYLPTAPTPVGREEALAAAKSAVDDAIRQIRAAGASNEEQEAIRERWQSQADDPELWGHLADSVAIFLAPDMSEEYVLPNQFEAQTQVGDYFDLGQLLRSVTAPQDAFALTLSGNGWNVWVASATTRAHELDLSQDYPEDAEEATNRMTVHMRERVNRLVAAEGRKALLERYAHTVGDALRAELGRLDPNATKPLFVFAAEPLLGMILAEDLPWQTVPVPGAPDELRPDQIDDAIRTRIGALTSARLSRRADEIGNGLAAGLATNDLAHIARACVQGAVAALIYDFTTDVLGVLDDTTGEITYDERGYDLLSRIAVLVLRQGGEAMAVRPDEIHAQSWDGRALAQLRFPLI